MSSLDSTYLLIFAVFFAFNVLLLRLSCQIANVARRWSPRWPLLNIPRIRTCIVMVLGVSLVFGLVVTAAELFFGPWAPDLFPHPIWPAIVAMAEIVLVVNLFAWVLADEQPAPTRRVILASVIHVSLLIAVCIAAGQVLASF